MNLIHILHVIICRFRDLVDWTFAPFLNPWGQGQNFAFHFHFFVMALVEDVHMS